MAETPKAWCSIHECHPAHCFFEHQKNGVIETVEEPMLMIVLPCNHLIARPTTGWSKVECQCGRRWVLTSEAAGKAWDAKETTA